MVLYNILNSNIDTANLTYRTAPQYTVPFIWYQKAISLMLGSDNFSLEFWSVNALT